MATFCAAMDDSAFPGRMMRRASRLQGGRFAASAAVGALPK
jgi:hypothetical protein